MSNAIILIILFIGICVGIVALQISLSKKENKWAGLILPIISFGISLMALFAVLLFSASTGTLTLTQEGEVIEQTVTQISDLSTIIGTGIYIFLLYNIPTAILVAIYAACRGKRSRQRTLEKMSIQDLE